MAYISEGLLTEGTPEPLGVTFDGSGVNVAVFSTHATTIEFCLFDVTGATETVRVPATSSTVMSPASLRVCGTGCGAHGPSCPAMDTHVDGFRCDQTIARQDTVLSLVKDRPRWLSVRASRPTGRNGTTAFVLPCGVSRRPMTASSEKLHCVSPGRATA
jgi:hypothetical protein